MVCPDSKISTIQIVMEVFFTFNNSKEFSSSDTIISLRSRQGFTEVCDHLFLASFIWERTPSIHKAFASVSKKTYKFISRVTKYRCTCKTIFDGLKEDLTFLRPAKHCNVTQRLDKTPLIATSTDEASQRTDILWLRPLYWTSFIDLLYFRLDRCLRPFWCASHSSSNVTACCSEYSLPW